MDAAAYQRAFDMEQLAILCANYDRRIDSLDAENKQLQAENAKLRELVRDMWRELAVACAEQVTSHETLRKVSDRMRELGIEVYG